MTIWCKDQGLVPNFQMYVWQVDDKVCIEGYLYIIHGSANNLVDHSICVSYKGTEVWERLLRDRMDYESNKKLAAQVLGLHLKIDDMLKRFSTVFSNTYGWQLDEELRIFLSLYTSDLRWGLSTHQTTGRYWSSHSITQFVCLGVSTLVWNAYGCYLDN